jgi:hypothetical protein
VRPEGEGGGGGVARAAASVARERAIEPRKPFPTYRGGEHSPGEGRGMGWVRSPCVQPNANVACPRAIRPVVRSAREKAGIPPGSPETKQALREYQIPGPTDPAELRLLARAPEMHRAAVSARQEERPQLGRPRGHTRWYPHCPGMYVMMRDALGLREGVWALPPSSGTSGLEATAATRVLRCHSPVAAPFYRRCTSTLPA